MKNCSINLEHAKKLCVWTIFIFNNELKYERKDINSNKIASTYSIFPFFKQNDNYLRCCSIGIVIKYKNKWKDEEICKN